MEPFDADVCPATIRMDATCDRSAIASPVSVRERDTASSQRVARTSSRAAILMRRRSGWAG